MFYPLDALTSPAVEISDTTYSTFTVRWKNINFDVSRWRLRILDEEDNTVEVRPSVRIMKWLRY